MARDPSKPKEKRGCLTSFLVFILIIVVIVGGAILYFRMNIPEDVEYTDKDVDAFYEKMDIEPGNYAFGIMEFMQGDVIAEGSREVDAVFTSEEFTGGMQNSAGFIADSDMRFLSAQEGVWMSADLLPLNVTLTEVSGLKDYSGNVFLTDVSFRFTGPDEMEIIATPTERFKEIYDYVPELTNFSFAVDQVVGSTMYVRTLMTYSPSSGIYLDAQEISLNGIPVPMNVIDPYEGDFSSSLNNAINRIDKLQIEILEITNNGLHFKGTVPEFIRNSN